MHTSYTYPLYSFFCLILLQFTNVHGTLKINKLNGFNDLNVKRRILKVLIYVFCI